MDTGCGDDARCRNGLLADGQYWVVGSRASNKCEIVTSNPVIYPTVTTVRSGSGPALQSLADARLARSTISQCPNRSLKTTDSVSAERCGRAHQPALGYRRIDLRQLGLQLLVDQQQRLQRAADVAIAGRHDAVDGSFACLGSH